VAKDALGHGSEKRGGSAAHSAGVDAVGQQVMSAKALDIVRKNPTGFSVKPEGSTPSSGYMVSIPGHSVIMDANEFAKNPSGHVAAYADEHAGALTQPNAHVGGWTNEGKMYLDVSQNIPDQVSAVKAGVARNQKAIFDLHSMSEVPTGGTGDDKISPGFTHPMSKRGRGRS
jgi:hypothetical protein